MANKIIAGRMPATQPATRLAGDAFFQIGEDGLGFCDFITDSARPRFRCKSAPVRGA